VVERRQAATGVDEGRRGGWQPGERACAAAARRGQRAEQAGREAGEQPTAERTGSIEGAAGRSFRSSAAVMLSADLTAGRLRQRHATRGARDAGPVPPAVSLRAPTAAHQRASGCGPPLAASSSSPLTHHSATSAQGSAPAHLTARISSPPLHSDEPRDASCARRAKSGRPTMDACEGSRASRRGGVAAPRHESSVLLASRTGLRLAPHPPNLGVGHRSSVVCARR
jgi:hypothetical protein